MSEITLPDRIYHSIKFEFDDISILDLQMERGDKLWFNFPPNDAQITTAAVSNTHEHKGELVIPEISFLFMGDRKLFTKERAVNVGTVGLLGWLADCESEVTFVRAEMRTINPSINDDMVIQDITIEARVVESEYNIALKLLRATQPSDF